MDHQLTSEEKARAAKREYMKMYRKTQAGRDAIRRANNRYWEKKFDELAEEFRALKDNSN